MADTFTPNLNLTLVEVGASDDSWGDKLNGNTEAIDAAIGAIEANDWVTTLRILDGAVIAAKLATDAVETAKIKDLAVTAAKLAADAVETAKIKDAAVTNAKLASMAQSTIKGRKTASTGAPEDMTVAELKGIMGYPTSSTDNAVVRHDNTTGGLQGSGVSIDDSNQIAQTSTGANTIPNGTTGQRPAGVEGMFRYNSTLKRPEYHDGTAWRPLLRVDWDYISAETVLSEDPIDFTHGLGATPTRIACVLRCKVTDSLYAVGDEVFLFDHMDTGGGQVSVRANATEVSLVITDPIRIPRWVGGGLVDIVDTSWRIVMRASL